MPSIQAHAANVASISKFTGKGKKGKKGKGAPAEEAKTAAEELAASKPLEGSVTCVQFSDGCQVLAEAELFVGFENGAIGLFRISLGPSVSEGVPGPIKTFKMFTAQKLI